MKIVVTGINKTTGDTVGPFKYNPELSGGRRRAHEKACYLRSENYFVVVVDPYKVHEHITEFECGFPVGDLVKYPYKVHSINTVNERNQGSHIGFVKTLGEAIERAGTCVKSWNPEHKGVVIFKAVKLVRYHASPVEIIDL